MLTRLRRWLSPSQRRGEWLHLPGYVVRIELGGYSPHFATLAQLSNIARANDVRAVLITDNFFQGDERMLELARQLDVIVEVIRAE